ncbi:MAG: ABC transporter ATP-binding protein [Polyangiaceae bacterium]|nr:ABC transporter ATP-binding protein [Polyangiaceae bacterium]
MALLSVSELTTEFRSQRATVRAVDRVSFELAEGEVLGLVGESGCGKSATCLSILGLLPEPHGRIVAGSIVFQGQDLAHASEQVLQKIRGRRISMIFQDPMTSLNPYLTLEDQLTEVPMLHLGLSKAEAVQRAVRLLDQVRIGDAKNRIKSYPHELSGGMRQRVMIAMALLCDPDLLIADEPTTALDVTIQAQILDLLLELKAERKLSIILITHDLGVVADTADQILIMYAGRVLEQAPCKELFASPLHPYTRALLESAPRLEHRHGERLESIEGMPPRLDRGGFSECSFAPRCALVREECRREEPRLEMLSGRHAHRCVLRREELE